MQVNSRDLHALDIKPLPDGSRIIMDRENDSVVALNATAGAALDACRTSTTLPQITEQMRRSLSPEVTEDLAEQAILQLAEKNLVIASRSTAQPTRRQMLGSMSAAIALPLVVSLSLADQKAYAFKAKSTPPKPPPPPPPPPHWPWW